MRDRNHPSVIMWSICNEFLCNNFNATSAQIIKDIMNLHDPTRPVTAVYIYTHLVKSLLKFF